jgi:hypothetical protein
MSDLATTVLHVLMTAPEPMHYDAVQARVGVRCDRTLCAALMALEGEGQIGRRAGLFLAL